MSSLEEIFGKPIHVYTRAQAIEDGVLVDVSEAFAEAGIKWPVAMTATAFSRYAEPPEVAVGQSLSGRLWDLAWMLRMAIQSGKAAMQEQIAYKLHVFQGPGHVRQSNEKASELGEGHVEVTLKCVLCGGDDGLPVLTVMLPEED